MLSDDARFHLRESVVVDQAKLTAKLMVDLTDSPELYQEIHKALVDLGGRYASSGKRNGRFKYVFDPSELIRAVGDTGVVNPLALFETPAKLADLLVRYHPDIRLWCSKLGWSFENDDDLDHHNEQSDFAADARLLEPSAGRGAIIRALLERGYQGHVVAVEPDPTNVCLLQQQFGTSPRIEIVPMTFEDAVESGVLTGYVFDGAIMNPPFSVDGNKNLYIDHINLALSLVRKNHSVAAIVPTGWRQRGDKKESAFRQRVQEDGEWESQGRGQFKSEGTPIETGIVTIKNSQKDWSREPWPAWSDPENAYLSYRCGWLDNAVQGGDTDLYARRDNLFDRLGSGMLPLDMFGNADSKSPAGKAILEFYQFVADIVEKESDGDSIIVLTPHEQQWMVNLFLDQYHTHHQEVSGLQAVAA
jgi:hypothetical protein